MATEMDPQRRPDTPRKSDTAGTILLASKVLCLLCISAMTLQISVVVLPQIQDNLETITESIHGTSDAAMRLQASAQDSLEALTGAALEIKTEVAGSESRPPLRDEILRSLNTNLFMANHSLSFTACGLVGTPNTCGPRDMMGWGALPWLASNLNHHVGVTAGETQRVLKRTVQLQDLVGDQFSEFFDCEAVGASCLQNRIFNTTAAMQRASEAIADATPSIAASIERNAQNTEKITDNVGRITSRFAGPRSVGGYIWEGVKTTAFVAKCVVLLC